MDNFFPFIHEKQKKEQEPQPLYIELVPPPPQPPKKNDDEDETPGVIIIQL